MSSLKWWELDIYSWAKVKIQGPMVVKIKYIEMPCAVFLCSFLKFRKLIFLVLANSLLQF